MILVVLHWYESIAKSYLHLILLFETLLHLQMDLDICDLEMKDWKN